MVRDSDALDAVRRDLDITVYELWIAYVSMGGSTDAFVLKGYLDGSIGDDAVGPLDHDIIEQALAEISADLGLPNPFPPRR